MRIENATPSAINRIWQHVQIEIDNSRCLEEAAQALAATLYHKFPDSVLLTRTFLTLPFSQLPNNNQEFVRHLTESVEPGADLKPDTLVLSLIGSYGEKPQWTDRRLSQGHMGIPLISSNFIDRIPMISRLLKELGLPLGWVNAHDSDSEIVEKLGESLGLFFVSNASEATDHENRKIISDQEFVDEFGVKTVFGLGGAYLAENIFVTIVFCRDTSSRTDAERLKSLIDSYRMRTRKFLDQGKVFHDEMASHQEPRFQPSSTVDPIVSLSKSDPPSLPPQVDLREYRLFRSLDIERRNEISVADILDIFSRVGLPQHDLRLRDCMGALNRYTLRDQLDYNSFCEAIRPNILIIEQALQGNLVIPDFKDFCHEIESIYLRTRPNRTGKVADYIPQLAKVDPDLYGMALCTIDGQCFEVGDSQVDFCVQSCTKPINYCLALEEHGEEGVHRYVGREPSGRNFNELTLNQEGKPHNPMINSGAIICSSLIQSHLDAAGSFDYVLDRWRALCGNQKVGFSNTVYQSERKHADRNFAIGYYLREHHAFPEHADLLDTLEFYFQCCSIEVNAQLLSVLAATLANGGVCPTTGERIFKTSSVRHCLTLMCSCGMYDFSGEFAFEIGLPAKSGVAGALVVVIPNVMGFCIFSPRLDSHGNSVRGLDFCKQFVRTFNFHYYDNLTGYSEKVDPRLNRIETKARKVDQLIWAASKGDLGAIHRLIVRGFDQDAADYDRRTPLHLASAEGRLHVVEYFLANGASVNPRDRWGGTPYDDATRHGHSEVERFLKQHGGIPGNPKISEEAMKRREAESALMYQDSNDIVELIYAASEGDLPSILRLVARGIDLDGADYDHRTPLHLAAAEGHEHVVQYFIDQGVKLSPQDRWGGTPLDDAHRHGHTRVAQLLETALSLVSSGSEDNVTSLHPLI